MSRSRTLSLILSNYQRLMSSFTLFRCFAKTCVLLFTTNGSKDSNRNFLLHSKVWRKNPAPVRNTSTFSIHFDNYCVTFQMYVKTNGACIANHQSGQSGRTNSTGIYFGKGHPSNYSEPLHGVQTNQRAEIRAASRVLEQVRRSSLFSHFAN